MKPRDWYRAREPVRLDEVTAVMLAPIRLAADKSGLPQTVWPSQWFGAQYVGADCLLVSMASVWVGFRGKDRPAHAAEASEPLLTIIPAHYYYRPDEEDQSW